MTESSSCLSSETETDTVQSSSLNEETRFDFQDLCDIRHVERNVYCFLIKLNDECVVCRPKSWESVHIFAHVFPPAKVSESGIWFLLRVWNKVCCHHKLKIFTRFVLFFFSGGHVIVMSSVCSLTSASYFSLWTSFWTKRVRIINLIIFCTNPKIKFQKISSTFCRGNHDDANFWVRPQKRITILRKIMKIIARRIRRNQAAVCHFAWKRRKRLIV